MKKKGTGREILKIFCFYKQACRGRLVCFRAVYNLVISLLYIIVIKYRQEVCYGVYIGCGGRNPH